LGAHDRAVVLARGFVEQQVRLAREMRRIAETKTCVALACASIEEYGVRLGLTARDARQLVALGHALDEAPAATTGPGAAESSSPAGAPATVGEAVLAGVISVEKAALAGLLLAPPGLLREGENAVAIATSQPVRRVEAILRQVTERPPPAGGRARDDAAVRAPPCAAIGTALG